MKSLPILSGIAAFLMTGVWCTTTRIPAIESDLEARVTTALGEAAIGFHALDVNGLDVDLTGVPATAVETARDAAGGVWGVRSVTVAPGLDPAGGWFRIEEVNGAVTVSGEVATPELQSRIRRQALRGFPGREVRVEVDVGDVGPTPISWPSTFEPLFRVASRRIGALALTMDASVLTVTGTVIHAGAVDSLGAQFFGAAPGVRLHNALEEAPTDHDRILAALSGRDVSFDEGTTRLTPSGRLVLGGVVEAVRHSGPVALRVVVHADPPSDAPSDRRFAARRAESIVRFLAQSGVPPERLTGEGRGTAEGEVERVEFEITEG